MALLSRFRSAATVEDLRGIVHAERARESGLRIVLYGNPKRIGDAFAQRLPNVVENVTNGAFTAEVSGGVAAIIGAKAGATVGTSQRIEITPLLQVLLLEEAANEDGSLVDLRLRPGQLGDELLQFTGNGYIFGPDQPVESRPDFGLGQSLAHHLQAAREQQERSMRQRDPAHPGAFVCLAFGAGPVATIASFREADENYDSYSTSPPFGVIGHYEGGPDPLTRLAPLMIWHLASNKYPAPGRANTLAGTAPSDDIVTDPGSDRDRRSMSAPRQAPLGDYEILTTIHTGPLGRVLKCRRDGRVCVVKETTAPYSRDALAELSGLRCPNLAAPSRLWESSGVLYEELPYIDGVPLSSLIPRGESRISGALLRSMQHQLDEVLRVLHSVGVVHRDVHPENVFLVVRPAAAWADGEYLSSWEAFSSQHLEQARKAGDPERENDEWAYDAFGTGDGACLAAWVLGDCTFAVKAGAAEQLPCRHGAYTPPEQANGAAVSASDMFSLGATLYYAMSGREPPPSGIEVNPPTQNDYFIGQHVVEMLSAQPERRPRAGKEVREGSIFPSYCGTLDLGDDTYLVMNSFHDRTVLAHSRTAAVSARGRAGV